MLITMLTVVLGAPQGQPPPTQSLLMDLPITVMGTAPGSELMLSEADGGLVPMSQVDPRFAAIVTLPQGLRINSFSRGTGALYSRMPSAGFVHPEVGTDGWSFMVFSVTGTGWAADSAYHAEMVASGSITGDVFGLILEGSDTWFPPEQVGTVHKVREGSEIGLGTLVDIDTFLPGYAATDDYVADADADLGGGTLRFYFTLFGSDYLIIPQNWGPAGILWKKPSTIFVVERQQNSWSTPTVFMTANELGLDPNTVIDALSVMDPDFTGAPHDRKGIDVLLSTEDTDLDHQLWISGKWWNEQANQEENFSGPLRHANGGLFVVSALKINDGTQQRIDAFCGDDPGDDGASGPHHLLRQERMALLEAASGHRNLDFSLHQIRGPAGGGFTRFRATFQGFVGPHDRNAVLRVAGVPPSLWPFVSVPRDPTDRFLDKQVVEFNLPVIGYGPHPVTMKWIVCNASGMMLGESHEYEILVR